MPIAVIGMALRIPGATTTTRFWSNLIAGRDCISRPAAAVLRQAGIGQQRLAHPDFVRALPILDDVEHFDADFFAMSAREAELTDPSQRLFLECAWESLESAGVVPGRDGPVTGVFGGFEGNYRDKVLARSGDLQQDPGMGIPLRIDNTLDFLTPRVSYKLDLTGPSFGVFAACATSLLAVDLAVQSLRRGECAVALAGGATIDLPRQNGYVAAAEGMLSPTGRLRPFDAAADGTIFGSGVGVVALRPLADALAAGNPIHAVIRGSASSNDGSPEGKESFIAPSPEGQIAAIEAALRDAGISPESIGYVEAHGTGTRLGDPVEVAALTEVYRRHTRRTGYCSLGSVKANVGHLRCGAGVASLIKACLALSHRTLPPLANFQQPNPRIDFAAGPFFVHADARPWAAGPAPRRAAVSSFGFGGSNVHVVPEEHRPAPSRPRPPRAHLLVVSARTEAALGRRIDGLRAHLEGHPGLAAADVAHTLQRGRRAFAHRACFLADGEAIAAGALDPRRRLAAGGAPSRAASPVFLFPGQGAQRPGAGRDLYVKEALFGEIVDKCADALAPDLGLDLRTLLGYGVPAAGQATAAEVLRRTANAQPALFVIGYATARLVMSWGVAPAAMLGHSLGELVAACLAGVFSLADGLKLVAARARLMQACAPGSMAAVFLPDALLAPRLPAALDLAAVNTPSISVVSGPDDAVTRFCQALEREGVATQRIETSHAFHSRMMDPALPEFARVAAVISLAAPRIPVISNATGLALTAEQATDPGYWAAHIRNPVRYSAGIAHLLSLPAPVFVELGPGSMLCDLTQRHDPAARVFPVLALPDTGRDETLAARAALGGLWCAGVEVDWSEGADGERHALLALPTYPFQRARHWYEANPAPRRDPRKTLYERGFGAAPVAASAPPDRSRTWLVLGADGGLCRARVALTARWEPPPEETWPVRATRDDKIGRSLAGILALRARGAEVFVVAADITDRVEVARAVGATKARFGGLHGIVHAAGAADPTLAVEMTREGAARVFGPKVHGAFHLEELLADAPLDLFLQISSQASQFPEPGQVDYAAANAVLDVLAQNRAARHRGLSCATGWGPWQEVGLAANSLRQTKDAREHGAGAAAGAARGPRRVVVTEPGNLDSLRMEAFTPRQPGPGEVQIEVYAAGLNFRDVLAAVQIARLRGAEIFATAGHPEKRDYLRSLGVAQVFDSRSLAFVDEIRSATGGEGVDVVLNSLAGEFIPASLGLLRSQGRFIEIGKRDLQADTPLGLAPFLRNLSFTAFDLGRIVDERHPMLPPMFDALLDRFACGELQPLPTGVIAFEQAADGFRRMARAQHIGRSFSGFAPTPRPTAPSPGPSRRPTGPASPSTGASTCFAASFRGARPRPTCWRWAWRWRARPRPTRARATWRARAAGARAWKPSTALRTPRSRRR